MAGNGRRGAFQVHQALIRPARRAEQQAEVVVGIAVLRFQAQDLAVARLGFSETPGLMMGQGMTHGDVSGRSALVGSGCHDAWV